MWSGPRNISTTMMRAWGNRSDTIVCDEPFYAHYLKESQFDHHPGYEEVLEHHETDWRKVVELLTAPLPEGKTIFYQKQMAHHMLGDVQLDWTDQFTSVFLIRDPREMLLSLLEFFPSPRVEETGLPQQLELYRLAEQRLGHKPVVVDSKDVLLDPRGMLSELCRQIEVPFDEKYVTLVAGHSRDRRRMGKALVRQGCQDNGVRPISREDGRRPRTASRSTQTMSGNLRGASRASNPTS